MAYADRADTVALPGALSGPGFDLALIFGLTALALASGVVIALEPAAVAPILFADTWLLGYPHVAATFSRLAPDSVQLKRNRFLMFGLPVIVLAATAGLAIGIGVAVVATIYFYWQWYHTMRQSWGIAQLYRRRSPVPVRENPLFAEALFALVPLWGLLHRMTTAPDHFIYPNLPLSLPYVPAALANGVGALACLGLVWWTVCRVREAMAGELPLLHTLFSASNYLIFIVGYIVMDDITGGWLVTNIWHTAQYLMLVWVFNENQNGKPANPGDWFRRFTDGNRAWAYMAVCIVLAWPVYALINASLSWGATGLMVALIASQTLNFHHFIVDSVIWRARRKPAAT
jgi:hypothetical protein